MGILDWWNRNFGPKEIIEGKYVLKRQAESGGMAKVMDLAGPTSIDELYQHLEPGIYALHQYKKGQSGFDVVWGPVEVQGDKPARPSAAKGGGGGSALETFASYATELAKLKEDAKAQFEAIAPLFGFGTPAGEPKSIIEQLREARDDYNALGDFFGDRTSGAEPIKYEGAVPIWLHPGLIPELLDTSLEKIERRLTKWGVVDDEKDKVKVDDDLPPFPPKPKPKTDSGSKVGTTFVPDELEDVEDKPEEGEEEDRTKEDE